MPYFSSTSSYFQHCLISPPFHQFTSSYHLHFITSLKLTRFSFISPPLPISPTSFHHFSSTSFPPFWSTHLFILILPIPHFFSPTSPYHLFYISSTSSLTIWAATWDFQWCGMCGNHMSRLILFLLHFLILLCTCSYRLPSSFNGIARTLKKLCTSKGDNPIKQWFSSIVSLSIIGTSLKGKNLLPEGANSFLLEQFPMAWKITFTTLGDLPWMLLFLLRMCVSA